MGAKRTFSRFGLADPRMGRNSRIFLRGLYEGVAAAHGRFTNDYGSRNKDVVDLSIIDAAYGADPDEQLVKLQQLESAICNTLQKGVQSSFRCLSMAEARN